ncbi:4'-phosphopantetheinyl transferase family protein [Paenibacillus tepidiphilus]|uniref:4'-phosphopantetheinyl transferase family protein n=1 Tax=Paenibacillus tepidiphilus TaxID=2608683 RepID=UPI00123965FA|nr:4'-phosphopantetheinyl transferase superfamily protein [Paenibacillus tepidiphilus]
MIDVYYMDINEETGGDLYEKLLGACAPGKREEAEQYVREADRRRTVYGEALSRYMIAKRTGMRMRDIEIGRNPYGKPFVQGDGDLHYNVSHSGSLVACGLDRQAIGIDVEQVQNIDMVLAEQFFHIREYSYILSREFGQRMNALYDFWTLKESYVKYLGVGLYMPLNSFYFSIDGPSVTLNAKDSVSPYFQRCHIREQYKLAVCTGRPVPVRLQQLSLHEIIVHIDRESG